MNAEHPKTTVEKLTPEIVELIRAGKEAEARHALNAAGLMTSEALNLIAVERAKYRAKDFFRSEGALP